MQTSSKKKTVVPPAARVAALADLDIKLLRVFMTVVEEHGYVGAQSRLNLAPSTLSEHIKDLELRLGFTVCLRGRRGFSLTEQGESLYDASRQLFEQLEAFRNQAAVISNRLSGVIRLGIVDGLTTERRLPVPDVIREFAKRFPSVEVHISVEPPPDLETGLLEGLLDVAIGPFPEHRSGLVYDQIFTETQSLYCGQGNPLYGQSPERVTNDMLKQARFVAYDYPSREDRAAFVSKMSAKTVEAMTMLILSGGYIGFLPNHAAQSHAEQRSMWNINPGRFAYDCDFSIVTRNVSVQDPAQRSFARLLKTHAVNLRTADCNTQDV